MISFGAPRDLQVEMSGAARQSFPAVSVAIGQVESQRGDSIRLRVTELRSATARHTFPLDDAHRTNIEATPDVTLKVINANPGRTQRMFFGGIIGAIGFITAVIISCRFTPCMS